MSSSSIPDTQAGAAVYSPLVLKLYDAWVLGISNRLAWQCPTHSVLLPFYRKHLGSHHLDVGVGTGFYLEHAGFSPDQQVGLLDMNETSLRTAARRMKRPHAGLFLGDVMKPVTMLDGQRYDSIALFYLLHCLPGTMLEKSRVFANLRHYLHRDGVIYGATILGDEADHNWFGRKLMQVYNNKGIFGNRTDSLQTLRYALELYFAQVDIRVQARVALFVAKEARLGF